MSFSSTDIHDQFTGNGSVNAYGYGFKIYDDDEIAVVVSDTDGIETTLTKTTDYTVSGVGSGTGGIVTLVSSGQAWLTGGNLTTGYKITLRSNMPFTQETDLVNQGTVYPEEVEKRLDYMTKLSLQLKLFVDRAVKLPISIVSGFNVELPPDVVGAVSKVPVTNASGNGFAPADEWPTADEIFNAEASAIAAAASAAAASDSEDAAADSETNAAASEAAAIAAKNAAETAETNAELAETHAETAETNSAANAQIAVDARDAAQGYSVAAGDAKDDAEAAALSAQGSETAAAASAALAQASAEIINALVVYANDADYVTAHGAATNGDIYYNSTINKAKLYAAGGWTILGAGGGVGALRWYLPDSLGANKRVLSNGLEVYDFENIDDQAIFASFTVPASFVAGTQMFLKKGKAFSSVTSGNFLFKSTAYILKQDIDATATPTGYASTNAQQAIDATTNEARTITDIDLTNASGQINAVSVAAGDTILVKLVRSVSTETSGVAGTVSLFVDGFELVTS